MTLGGYDAFDDPYSYEGSACLKNRLGLRDPDVLQAFELEMSSLRAGELNAIHPFRDGNGRSQLAFVYLVALRAGHPLRLERLEPETFMAAMLRSFDGDLTALREELAALFR